MSIPTFNNFLNEGINDYQVGDLVLIRYNRTGDITPVKIIEKKTHGYFIVSHKVKGSFLYNSPDHGVKVGDIVGRYRGVSELETTPKNMNPNYNPNVSGQIPGWDSYNNDISF